MKRDEQEKQDVKEQTVSNSPSSGKNTGEQEPLRNPAEEDLGDLDRNLNEQFGGTGTTVRVEPNKF